MVSQVEMLAWRGGAVDHAASTKPPATGILAGEAGQRNTAFEKGSFVCQFLFLLFPLHSCNVGLIINIH